MRTAGFITRYLLKRAEHHLVPSDCAPTRRCQRRAGTCHDPPDGRSRPTDQRSGAFRVASCIPICVTSNTKSPNRTRFEHGNTCLSVPEHR
jgi:hypothetical protein